LPAIPVGIAARVGEAGGQRLALPLALVRAPEADPGRRAHNRALLERAVEVMGLDEALVGDCGFLVSELQAAGCPRWAVRCAKNFTARRAALPPSRGGAAPPPRRGVAAPRPRPPRPPLPPP